LIECAVRLLATRADDRTIDRLVLIHRVLPPGVDRAGDVGVLVRAQRRAIEHPHGDAGVSQSLIEPFRIDEERRITIPWKRWQR
jgi:hypothetical protein